MPAVLSQHGIRIVSSDSHRLASASRGAWAEEFGEAKVTSSQMITASVGDQTADAVLPWQRVHHAGSHVGSGWDKMR